MSEEIISIENLEKRYKKIVIRTEETVNPFSGEKEKRTVVDLIHDGIIYYVHIEFSPFGTTEGLHRVCKGNVQFPKGERNSQVV